MDISCDIAQSLLSRTHMTSDSSLKAKGMQRFLAWASGNPECEVDALLCAKWDSVRLELKALIAEDTSHVIITLRRWPHCKPCSQCRSLANVRLCAGCSGECYCSVTCQKISWRAGHKDVCPRYD